MSLVDGQDCARVTVTTFDGGLNHNVPYAARQKLCVSADGALQASCALAAAFAHLVLPDDARGAPASAAAASRRERGGFYAGDGAATSGDVGGNDMHPRPRQPFGDSFTFGDAKATDAAVLRKAACDAVAAPEQERGWRWIGAAKQPEKVRYSLTDDGRRGRIETAICNAWAPHAALLRAAAAPGDAATAKTTAVALELEFSATTVAASTVVDRVHLHIPMFVVPLGAVSTHNAAAAHAVAAKVLAEMKKAAAGALEVQGAPLPQACHHKSLLDAATSADRGVDVVDDAGALAAVCQLLLEVNAAHPGFCPTHFTASVEITTR